MLATVETGLQMDTKSQHDSPLVLGQPDELSSEIAADEFQKPLWLLQEMCIYIM